MIPVSLTRAIARTAMMCLLLATCESITHSEPPELEVFLSGTGAGRVTGPGIDCGDDCVSRYAVGRQTTLTAVPDLTSTFAGWSRDCHGLAQTTTFAIDRTPQCEARFDLLTPGPSLHVDITAAAGSTGKVSGPGIECGDGSTDCDHSYPLNTQLRLTVSYPSTSRFTGWSRDCATFGSSQQVDLTMTADRTCVAGFDLAPPGMQAKGSFTFAYRVEAGALSSTKVIVAGYDNTNGQVIDVSNPNTLTSAPGPEFNTVSGARKAIAFFSTRPQYNGDVFFATSADGRSAGTTPVGGGFTELQNLGFSPGGVAHWTGVYIPIVDFENGALKITQQVDNPPAPVTIPLVPGQRSCPFSIDVHDSLAFIVGREGETGTTTANCNNWRGLWKVDLVNRSVLGFAAFGTKPREVHYGADHRVYVSDFEEDRVYVVDPGTMSVSRSFPVGDGPVGFALDNTAARMLIGAWNLNKVQLYNLANDSRMDERDSGGFHPVDVYWDGGATAFVLNFGEMAGNIGGSLQAFFVP